MTRAPRRHLPPVPEMEQAYRRRDVAYDGVFFLAVPGPGIPILLVGLALIAQESSTLARWLDRTEVRLRRWWKKLRR